MGGYMSRKSEEDKITDLLNQTGAPFQDWCVSIVRSIPDYRVVPEFVLTEILSPEESMTIDLLAWHTPRPTTDVPFRGTIFLIVECKRAKSTIKKWVFIPNQHTEQTPSFYITMTLGQGDSGQMCLTFPKLGYPTPESFEGCIQVFEFNETFTALNRGKEEKTYKAMKQANYGLAGFVNGQYRTTFAFSELGLPEWGGKGGAVYLPVVVTTADLLLARYDAKEVIGQTGEIPKDRITYKEKPWITFEFPLQKRFAFPTGQELRRTTFIVNANHWREFLENVWIVEDHPEDSAGRVRKPAKKRPSPDSAQW